ncbi:pterin-4-alpha-carbinolamine dehydratase [Glutamicibacter sp. BW80]|uniref:4a-hydroxytetrahydrobiopterin dehydratase n=1 Tax=Glutamicibacter sp. BW80 TaxID=2024404 RepID=UPI000BB6AB55|nr:4a-hydroxytetrahydrobiopterin dehydratase [Glutamicibacter sp. BW80]PCC28599.1 pterin-4-alpha-carbinolamine dehydratase [Glutamicibacter sp. BW80]
MSDKEVLDQATREAKLSQLPHWRYVLGVLRTAFKCPSAAVALEFFAEIGALAEASNHHPDVDWRYDTLFVSLVSHDVGGVSLRDTQLAEKISELAEKHGAPANLNLIRPVEIAIDTDDREQISEIWRTALGYKEQSDGSLTDPYGRGPAIWFQSTDTPNDNRFHVDVSVPHSHHWDIIDGLKLVGARLNHDHAPSFVVATDPQGNRLCVCTEMGR